MRKAEEFRLGAAIVGAQKAATSTLFELVRQHPDVSACRPKEPHHFVRDDWAETMDAYAARFPRWRKRSVALEASTSSGFLHRAETVAARMHEHEPGMRIVYVVREPVQRIVSAYKHARARGWGRPSLTEMLQSSSRLVDDTRYASCLRPYRDRFGPDQVLVLTFEEVTREQARAARRVFDFLGLPDHPVAPAAANLTSRTRLHHADDAKPTRRLLAHVAPAIYERAFKPVVNGADASLSADQAREVRLALRDEIEEVEAWTGRDLSAWYD